jgi:ribonuclease HII
MAAVVASKLELQMLSRGLLVAGVDEVGRGALAGPVVAAAIILPPELIRSCPMPIRDSKKLLPSQRQELYYAILDVALCWACRAVAPQVIDVIGIAAATRHAMAGAVLALSPQPDHVLVDGFSLPELAVPNTGVIRGDSLCLSIAAASIVAKVIRDSIMDRYALKYPEYGFQHHKGYGTPAHLEALRRFGPSPIHRRTFAPVATSYFYEPQTQPVG